MSNHVHSTQNTAFGMSVSDLMFARAGTHDDELDESSIVHQSAQLVAAPASMSSHVHSTQNTAFGMSVSDLMFVSAGIRGDDDALCENAILSKHLRRKTLATKS